MLTSKIAWSRGTTQLCAVAMLRTLLCLLWSRPFCGFGSLINKKKSSSKSKSSKLVLVQKCLF